MYMFCIVFIIYHQTVLSVPIEQMNREVLLEKLITGYDYSLEKHDVHTLDGYILRLHRINANKMIVRKNNSSYIPYSNMTTNAVLMMHGLLGSSADWVITGPNRSLAFMLADQGFDVWLGNNRGNTFSKHHTTLDINSQQFWNFSWHELGVYDIPATIDYVLAKSGESKLFYIGFSQGTTQFFVMNSMMPEYNKKIQLTVGLAPVAFAGHVQGILRLLAKLSDIVKPLLEEIGHFEFLPSHPIIRTIAKYVCRKGSDLQIVCLLSLFLIGGFGVDEVDTDHLEEFTRFVPAGCSTKQLFHYASEINHPGKFEMYDYGTVKNMYSYGSYSPPQYPLKRVTAPIVHFKGVNDWLSDIQDTELLETLLPNLLTSNTSILNKLNHFDFLYGIHIRDLVYARILDLLKVYQKRNPKLKATA